MTLYVLVRLSCSLLSEVGETFELILVDLLDDAVLHRRQDGFFASKVLVKVVHVPFGFLGDKERERRFGSNVAYLFFMINKNAVWTHNAWFERRPDLPLLQQRPVDLSEEGVGLDGLLAALAHNTAQTLGWVLCHELHKNTQHTLLTLRFSAPLKREDSS